MTVIKPLSDLQIDPKQVSGGNLPVITPIDGTQIGMVRTDDPSGIDEKISAAREAFLVWREIPAAIRGELIRLFGQELRGNKDALGALVTMETGKIVAEGLGEVQEMIDICDFAVGLSRQLYGLTIASERPGHRMAETWHPLGVVGLITAFNFPVAVCSWNLALAIVCGDSVVWKPSEKSPLTALSVKHLFETAVRKFGEAPPGLLNVVIGASEAGEQLVDDPRIALLSATGSTRMGRAVAPRVAKRFGHSLLELGGNNAMIVAPSADLDLATRAILFSAVGTAGQRCTTLRRLIVHESIYDKLTASLKKAYASIPIGDPRDPGVLLGPLIDGAAFESMQESLQTAKRDSGTVTGGRRVLQKEFPDAYYVSPALVEISAQTDIVRLETFAPVLYVMKYGDLQDAIAVHNDVPQGLASSIFTTDLREAEFFLSAAGSDCGIANVNIGPSGAEIGGAFGGEKETGGGRESGSDAWKAYMRRSTSTVNYSRELPLAQGVTFDLD